MAPQLTRWVPSSRTALGVSAIVDIATRLPEDILAPLLSILGGTVGGAQFGFLTTWVMFGVAFYTFGPLVFEHFTELPTDDELFLWLFSVVSVALGMCIQLIESVTLLVGFVVPAVFVSGGILLLYLNRRHDWILRDSDSKAASLLYTFTTEENARAEIDRDLSYEGYLGVAGETFFLFAVMLILGVPTFLAGMSAYVLAFAFPLPDLVFLTWALSGSVFTRVAIGPDRNRMMELNFDIEEFLIDRIELATRSLQGMFSTMFVILGLFLSAGYLFVVVSIAPTFAETLRIALVSIFDSTSVIAFLVVWNATGVLLLLLLAGVFSFWVWIRELGRLPHFLDEWEGRDTAPDWTTTRVTGFVAVPLAAWTAGAFFVTFESAGAFNWFSVTWPIVVGASILTVWHTVRRPAQPATNEHIVVLIGLGLQTSFIWVGANIQRIADSSFGIISFLSALAFPIGIFILLAVVALIPIVERYEQAHDDIRRYSLVGLLLGMGFLCTVAVPSVPRQYRVVMIALGVFGLASAVVLGLVRYYRL